MRQYRIETGERRYWATWLLRDFVPGYESDGMIPCIVIPAQFASPFRQAKENTARSGLSAIALARQAALLLLAVHGYEIPDGPVTMDFYRQALDLDLRSKREHTADILATMGGMSRQQFSRYKLLLRLSDEAIELADRHNLDEGVLRYPVNLPEEHHAEIVQQIVAQGLTVREVQSLCSGKAMTSLKPMIRRSTRACSQG
jgi:ParB-like chromosome segregation protein Spo0J